MKVQLGCAILRIAEDAVTIIQKMLDFGISRVYEVESHLKQTKTENTRLASERSEALRRLEKCVQEKEVFETNVFEKFVAILNAKKAKIRSLMSSDSAGVCTSSSRQEGNLTCTNKISTNFKGNFSRSLITVNLAKRYNRGRLQKTCFFGTD